VSEVSEYTHYIHKSYQWLRAQTFGDDLEVSLAVDLNSSLLNTRSSDSHLTGVSWLADSHQVRTLGDVLFSELDGDLVLAFHTRHIDTRVGR